MRITEGHLARHYQGRRGGRGPALLDIAQDHAIAHLHAAGLFEAGLVFKGGTSLRKFRAGSAGRFSTDLDFYAPDDDVTFAAMEALADVNIDGFVFRIPELGGDGRRAVLEVDTPFGRPDIGARIEVSQRKLSLPPDLLPMIPLPIHDRYDVSTPDTPIIAIEEAIAEKLARFRRVSLARDLYDLAWFANRQLDHALVRRLWVMKVYFDVVEDGRGDRPLSPDDVLRDQDPNAFAPEDIGYLTQPVDIPAWLAIVHERYAFLRDLDDVELRWSACNPGHRYEVETTGTATLGR